MPDDETLDRLLGRDAIRAQRFPATETPGCGRRVDVLAVRALARRDLGKPFAARLKEIMQAEGLDGQDMARYERCAKDCNNNLRMMISQGEAGLLLAK